MGTRGFKKGTEAFRKDTRGLQRENRGILGRGRGISGREQKDFRTETGAFHGGNGKVQEMYCRVSECEQG